MSYFPQVGDIVRMRSWHGVVLDVFKSETGRSVVRVHTVRNIFRKLGPELIELDLAPDQIMPATRQDLEDEIALHRRMQEGALTELLKQVTIPLPV
ncbi:MAG: hypothetical protein H6662_05115 [Ardenticatenaceae bacterium]|nr:hypothetical protein [Anaerolineales bacterium]MCB8920947.1 hypothetical protein [Ardenticatenaceae bacterium]